MSGNSGRRLRAMASSSSRSERSRSPPSPDPSGRSRGLPSFQDRCWWTALKQAGPPVSWLRCVLLAPGRDSHDEPFGWPLRCSALCSVIVAVRCFRSDAHSNQKTGLRILITLTSGEALATGPAQNTSFPQLGPGRKGLLAFRSPACAAMDCPGKGSILCCGQNQA